MCLFCFQRRCDGQIMIPGNGIAAIDTSRIQVDVASNTHILNNLTRLRNQLASLSPNADGIYQMVVNLVAETLKTQIASLVLFDEAEEELIIKAAVGPSAEDICGCHIKPTDSPVWSLITFGEAMLIEDIEQHPLFKRKNNSKYNTKSLIAAPLKLKHNIVGVVNANNKLTGEPFCETDKVTLAFLADEISSMLMDSLLLKLFPAEQSIWLKNIVGDSEAIRRLKEQIVQIAESDLTVLIRGDSGTGKELVARALHHLSNRAERAFIKVNCAALPETLLESELFGYERGAFTGAYKRKPGKFELADGGTIFLDEIGELSPDIQAKLLHVLEQQEFSRLGSEYSINVDVRILAATNKDLELAITEDTFRKDVFFRLNETTIKVPRLIEREKDIPTLVEHFIQKYSEECQKEYIPLSSETLGRLQEHNWPGNVRELENLIKRFVVFQDEEVIIKALNDQDSPLTVEDDELVLAAYSSTNWETILSQGKPISLKDICHEAILDIERRVINVALEATKWNRIQAAKLLGISYSGLRQKIKEYDLE